MSVGADASTLPVVTDREFEKPEPDHRLVTSLPHRRQPNFNENIEEEFFKLDEEEEEQKRRPINYYTDEIADVNDEERMHTTFDDDEDETDGTPSIRGQSERGSFVPSSMPIEICRRSQQKPTDGVERLVPLKKLEREADVKNEEEVEKLLSVREQTMYRNMQRLSFSVQPEDGPQRLWGDHSDWEDERRRRRCSFTANHGMGDEPAPQRPGGGALPPIVGSMASGEPSPLAAKQFATTAPGPRIHTPREPHIYRPSTHCAALIKTPGQLKRPGQMSQMFTGDPQSVQTSRTEERLEVGTDQLSSTLPSTDRVGQPESRTHTNTVDGVQRQPKM